MVYSQLNIIVQVYEHLVQDGVLGLGGFGELVFFQTAFDLGGELLGTRALDLLAHGEGFGTGERLK